MPYKDPVRRAEYNKEYQRHYYHRNKNIIRTRVKLRKKQLRKWFLEYKKTLVCEMCGHGHPPSVLDFHHMDEKTKTMAVSQMVNEGYSQKRILAEIDKCMVLCANHHRELHSNQRTIE